MKKYGSLGKLHKVMVAFYLIRLNSALEITPQKPPPVLWKTLKSEQKFKGSKNKFKLFPKMASAFNDLWKQTKNDEFYVTVAPKKVVIPGENIYSNFY